MKKMIEQIERGKQNRPRRMLLYGTAGIGKSSFGAMAERPIFLATEDGLDSIECDRFPMVRTLDQFKEAVTALLQEEHSYQTAVVDSADWLERITWDDVCREHGVKAIESIPYAKGYTFALSKWEGILRGLDALRDRRGMAVILIAHAKMERFENPETEPYDRYAPRLHKHASALIQEWADAVLFAAFKVHTRKVGEKFGQDLHKGIGTGERVIRTTERPGHLAKNRLGLPDEMPLDYRAYAAEVKRLTNPDNNNPQQQVKNH